MTETTLTRELDLKYESIKTTICSMERVVVAFSGGVDSALLTYLANQVLGYDALIVTSASKSLKRSDLQLTHSLAEMWTLNHRVIITDELSQENYRSNPTNRCYYCKTSLYSVLATIAKRENFNFVINGTNTDDLGDHRPGLDAAREFKVRSPYVEVGLNKQEVRAIATHLKLAVADKPQSACLSSRVPYGRHINERLLDQIEQAEETLSRLGFRQFRVRHHDEVARVEIDASELPKAFSMRDKIHAELTKCGYRFVALDLAGFQSGSLNRGIASVDLTD